MVVLFDREAVDVPRGVKRRAARLGFAQRGGDFVGINAGFDAEPDRALLALGIENIIALVLGVAHIEGVLDILGQRVHLQRKVLPVDGIEHIKPDRELGAEAGVHPLTQQRPRLGKHKVDRRRLDHDVPKAEQKAVFLRYAVKAPGVVAAVFGQVKLPLHPVAAPDARVVVRGHAEGPAGRRGQRGAVIVPRQQGGGALGRCVKVIVKRRQAGLFDLVAPAPFGKIAALVLAQLGQAMPCRAPVVRPAAEPQLQFPPGDVGIEQQVAAGHQGGPHAVDEHPPPGCGGFAGGFEFFGQEVIGQLAHTQDAEHPVVGQVAGQRGVEIGGFQRAVVGVQDRIKAEGFEHCEQLVLVDAGVAFKHDGHPLAPGQRFGQRVGTGRRTAAGPARRRGEG